MLRQFALLLCALLLLTVPPPAAARPLAYVTNNGSGSLSIVDPIDERVLSTTSLGDSFGPVGVAVAPSGAVAYVTNLFSDTITVVDRQTASVSGSIPLIPGSGPVGVAFSPDGATAYVTNFDAASVSVIDAATSALRATIAVADRPVGVAVSPDGSRAYVTNRASGSVSVIDTVSNAVVATIPVPDGPFGIALSPDGATAYVANAGAGVLSVVDASTATVSTIIPVGDFPAGVATSPSGAFVYVANNFSDTVSVIDARTREVTTTIPLPLSSGPDGIAISPDGTIACVTNFASDSVSLIATATLTVVATLSVGGSPEGIAFSPNGTRAGHAGGTRQRPRAEWIEIGVPAIVEERQYEQVAQRLEANQQFAARRTLTPTLLQGLAVCGSCGFHMGRTSRTRRRMFYRCPGNDNYRFEHGRVCSNPAVPQEHLDGVVWAEVTGLLAQPERLHAELERRLRAVRSGDSGSAHHTRLDDEQTRIERTIRRMLQAYQDELLTLDELRERLPAVRHRQRAVRAQLADLEAQAVDQAVYLQLADTVDGFLARLRATAEQSSVPERQRVVRLLVNEILVTPERLLIRHSIPTSTPTPPHGGLLRQERQVRLRGLPSPAHAGGPFDKAQDRLCALCCCGFNRRMFEAP